MQFNLSQIKQKEIEQPSSNGREESQSLVLVDLNLDTAKPRFAEYLEAVGKFESEAQVMEVKDDAGREAAANLAGGAKKLIKAIDQRRKEIIGPSQEFVKSVNGFASKFIDRLEAASKMAGQAEIRYIEICELKRREAEKLAQEASAKLQKEIDKQAKKMGIESVQVAAPVVPEVQTTARTEAGVTSFTVTSWDFEIIDDSDVPRLFCSADPKKIRGAVKNGVREIRGVRVFERTEIRHRS